MWLQLKQEAGKLTGSGEAELSQLQEMIMIEERLEKGATQSVYPTLIICPSHSEEARRIIDRVVAD